MNAETYNAALEILNADVARTSDHLKSLCPDTEKSSLGLVPDHIRFSPEYSEAKRDFDLAFQALRSLGKGVPNKVKREAAALRRSKMYGRA